MRKITTFLLLSLILVSCVSNRSQDPKIFFEGSTCATTCWHGLLLGQTTMAESKVLLASLPYVSKESFKADPDYLFWRFTDQASGQGRLYFDAAGQLKKIVLNPDGVILHEAIDSFGPPDYAWARYLPGDRPTYALTLYYPSRGITLDVRDEPTMSTNTSGNIAEDMRVSEIRFFAPTTIDQVLNDIDAWSPENVEYIRTHLQPWPGFGENVIQIKP